jgi:DNA-binding NarL/FixJ family response regulator
LTDREFEVFRLIGQGIEIKQMADQLHLSTKTVEVHRANIKTKLKLTSMAELIRYAVRWVEFQNTGG